ncbi:MAG: NGG1p interacting factor NIF3 [Gammaproteobacteria bacterium]|nr:MAG: NGG1p interacting factor NIF3 [Gammaproteobacteria bacterium]
MNLYQLVVYIPETHLEAVKTAIFNAGGGRYQNYDMCCWQTCGSGQFRPLDGSKPFIGETEKLEQVTEWRVEMICKEELLEDVIAALKESHPYEEPAFSYWLINTKKGR